MVIGTTWAAVAWMALNVNAAATPPPTPAKTLEAPWGKGETLGEKALLAKTSVCTDGKGHYVVSSPHPQHIEQLFVGDAKTLVKVNPPPFSLTGSSFFEPRYPIATNNSDFRGIDMRNYGEFEVKPEAKTCTVSCGKRNISLTLLEPEKAKPLLLSAKLQSNPQAFVPSVLLRDLKGRYYLVEKSTVSDEDKNFRLWVGPKGSMTQQKLVNSVTDSEGQIFSTREGELRLLLDRVKPSFWIERKERDELRPVPVEENWNLIYTELGVYRGARLGTPCDDL